MATGGVGRLLSSLFHCRDFYGCIRTVSSYLPFPTNCTDPNLLELVLKPYSSLLEDQRSEKFCEGCRDKTLPWVTLNWDILPNTELVYETSHSPETSTPFH